MEISFIFLKRPPSKDIDPRVLRDRSDFQSVRNRLNVGVDGLKPNLSDHLTQLISSKSGAVFEYWTYTAIG